MCPRKKLIRGSGAMSEKDAYSILDEAIKEGARSVKLEWFGETLMVPYWDKVAKYAKKKGLRTILITNGSLLTEHNIVNICKLIDKVFVSIDSADKKTYESIRQGLKFNVVMKGVKNLWEQGKDKIKIFITAVITKYNENQVDEIRRVFSNYSHRVIINKDNVNFEWDGKRRRVFCRHRFFDRLVVGWDKKCYLCCHDWLGEYPIGDLNKESMKEIQERKKSINLSNLKICQKCMLSLER